MLVFDTTQQNIKHDTQKHALIKDDKHHLFYPQHSPAGFRWKRQLNKTDVQ